MKQNESKRANWIQQDIQVLCDRAKYFGLNLDNKKARQLEIYAKKIVEWNQRINLVSPGDIRRIVDKHFTESLSIISLLDFPFGSNIIDLGTGAGFPGLPIKIARPDINLVLLDSKRMRTLFLRDVVDKLSLQDTTVLCVRAESLGSQQKYQEGFDFVLARAVAKTSLLWEWSFPLLRNSGKLAAFKGGKVTDEISGLKNHYVQINVNVYEIPSQLVPCLNDRKLIVVEKEDDL